MQQNPGAFEKDWIMHQHNTKYMMRFRQSIRDSLCPLRTYVNLCGFVRGVRMNVEDAINTKKIGERI